MKNKVIRLSGWILSGLLSLMFIMSAVMKIIKNDGAVEQATSIGINASTNQMLGIVEIISAILFIIPRTGVLGFLLLTSYMGGAIATHLQHGQSIAFVIVLQSLIWVAAGLRFKELRERLLTGLLN